MGGDAVRPALSELLLYEDAEPRLAGTVGADNDDRAPSSDIDS